jgi:hypothetical protein
MRPSRPVPMPRRPMPAPKKGMEYNSNVPRQIDVGTGSEPDPRIKSGPVPPASTIVQPPRNTISPPPMDGQGFPAQPIKTIGSPFMRVAQSLSQGNPASASAPMGAPRMRKGGKVKEKAYAEGGSVGSASKRADGIAVRGKTKCKMY